MIKTKALLSIALGAGVLFAALSIVYAYPEAMITVKVVDEEGNPMSGAEVGMGFETPRYGGTGSIPRRGLSNDAGHFSGSARTSGHVSYGAIKDGYYRTMGRYDFWKRALDRWQPWNPIIEVVLKKIVNPVPMYAKRVQIELPAADKVFGFDLVEADWVAPHGKGQKADFLFKLSRRYANPRDYEATLELRFSTPSDGIQSIFGQADGSLLRLPRHAPESGYEPLWLRTDSYANRVQRNPAQNYYYRVRSVEKDGQIERAMYGKIHNEIRFHVIDSKTAFVVFTYYLNPDGTRNVEFNAKRNLSKSLKTSEETTEP
jgi:hypothetical protein